MKEKCCIIGHRDVDDSVELRNLLNNIIEDLIVNKNVRIFLFGSKSDFDSICYDIISAFKEKYPTIKKVMYPCLSEDCILEIEKEKYIKAYEAYHLQLYTYDQKIEFKNRLTAGRASYIERNKAMIDDSDYCLFYYNENYLPPQRKYNKYCIGTYQPNSGTAIAYRYALQKKKKIINTFTYKIN